MPHGAFEGTRLFRFAPGSILILAGCAAATLTTFAPAARTMVSRGPLLLASLALLATRPSSAAWSSGNRGVSRASARTVAGSPFPVPSQVNATRGTSMADAEVNPEAHCFQACLDHELCESWTVRVQDAGCDGRSPGRARALCWLNRDVPRQQRVPTVGGAEPQCGGSYTASGVKAAAVGGLAPLTYGPLRLGSVKPAGWLRAQLVVMANGLSGALDEFWGDVNNSVWIGGELQRHLVRPLRGIPTPTR